MAAATEEEAAMREEGMVLAMGIDEEFAQRPMVMGGLLEATPWLGISQLMISHSRILNLLKASGQIQMRRYSTKTELPPLGSTNQKENQG